MMPEKYDFAQRSTDLKRIADLELVGKTVSNDDKIQLCCLIMRYGDEPKLIDRLVDLAIRWNRSPQMLLDECRGIWQSGYRPGQTATDIGSANDTEDDS